MGRVIWHDAICAFSTVHALFPLYRRLKLATTTKLELVLTLQLSPSDLPVQVSTHLISEQHPGPCQFSIFLFCSWPPKAGTG